tara:strand:+ start:1380 stop:2015 length:636 start_codon:yes stop_codon:yes gene_type:complete
MSGMSNEQLEKGLQASVKIYQLAQAKLVDLGREADAECVLSRAEIVDIKKSSAAMNRALTALVRESHDAENRLTLELHMLRGIMQREHTDREANRARVFELFRRYNGATGSGAAGSGGDDGASLPAAGAAGSSSNSGGGGSSNPLNAPTASAMAFDRALASLERIEQSMRDLSPVGRVNVHGAGLLSAKVKLDGSSDAESANKRSKTSSAT